MSLLELVGGESPASSSTSWRRPLTSFFPSFSPRALLFLLRSTWWVPAPPPSFPQMPYFGKREEGFAVTVNCCKKVVTQTGLRECLSECWSPAERIQAREDSISTSWSSMFYREDRDARSAMWLWFCLFSLYICIETVSLSPQRRKLRPKEIKQGIQSQPAHKSWNQDLGFIL